MHNFKVGDRVKYRYGQGGASEFIGKQGTVLGSDTKLGIVQVRWDNGLCVFHTHRFLVSLEPTDDPMPPVPGHTMYLNARNTKTLAVYPGSAGTLVLSQKNITHALVGATAIALTPETALALAADLTRMALKLKRDQEQEF